MGLRGGVFLSLFLVSAVPALADDGGLTAPSAALGDWTATLNVNLSGAAYAGRQDGGVNPEGLQAFAVLAPSLVRSFTDGWEIGAKASLLAYHDHLSGDNYGNDFFELAYIYAQTPYGRVEIGQQNGVAYSQSAGAPVVDGPAAINDANVTFFKDPASGSAFIGIFNLRTGVFISSNDAKINYLSPRFSGLQLSLSYTPYAAKGVLPFATRGHHTADRVADIVEGNLNYTAQIGSWNVQASTSFGAGRDAAQTPGHDDVWDWGAGFETDTALAGGKLSFGAAYRISNAYTFDIREAFDHGTTRNADLGVTYSMGPWLAGVEYETGTADGAPGLPGLTERGWSPSVAYMATPNLQLTLGYQDLQFHRQTGDFYNGDPSIGMDAVYLHANFQL